MIMRDAEILPRFSSDAVRISGWLGNDRKSLLQGENRFVVSALGQG